MSSATRSHTFEETREASHNPWMVWGVCLVLAAITWLVFGQVLHHGFINYDDADYVVANSRVAPGLSWNGIAWAFTHVHAGNWHPLTWISHMADCQFFGPNPSGHHLTNVLLHGATAVLLFLVLRQMTGSLWRSAFAAAVFAIHPLHVESVAWISQRKDVLGGLFFVLTLAAYARYVRRGGFLGYLTVMGAFVLGLMCKPTLVTVPLVLLLLDYWPLRCFEQKGATLGRLALEKLPFVVVAAAAGLMALLAQRDAIPPIAQFSFPLRLGNAALAYVDYLRQTFWPVDLAVFYPWEVARINWGTVGLALAILVAVSVLVFILRRRGYPITGWLWFLIMLCPVIGIVQAGDQAHADRYLYLPHIGLVVMITWGLADLVSRWTALRYVLGAIAILVLIPLGWVSRTQTSFWRDSETLWTRALSVTADNSVAEKNLGQVLYQQGRVAVAILHLERALQLQPNDAIAHTALGTILLGMPQQQAEALGHLQRSLEIYPKQAAVHSTLGVVLLEQAKAEESLKHLQAAVEIDPDASDAYYNLGNTFLYLARAKEAAAAYERACQINPQDTHALNNLAWILATWPDDAGRDGPGAVRYAEKADVLTQQRSAVIASTLSAAYAEVGRFPDAISTAERALTLATEEGDTARADFIKAQIDLYQAKSPLRDQRYAKEAPK